MTPPKRKGPAPYEPSPEDRIRVETYVACGTPLPSIARILGIGASTLRNRFKDEIELGSDKANAAVANALFRNATNRGERGAPGNVPPNVQVQAQVAWLKMRAGWSDKSDSAARVNVNVLGGGPVQVNVEALSGPDLDALDALMSRLALTDGADAEEAPKPGPAGR